MTSLLEGPGAVAPDTPLYGSQTPRILTVPKSCLSSSGQEAVELAALAGLKLDPWQQFVLDKGLGERPDGQWSAFEVAVNVPRQNGKGGVIEARELAGLFLLGEKLILHSAHEFKTSIVAFRRIEQLIMGCPDLRKRVLRVRKTTGEEAIELVTGQVLRFLARSGGSGRGFTGDCNVLDEAVILGDDATPERSHAAIAVAGRWRGGAHVEVVAHQPGMGWAVEKAKKLHERHKPRCWVVDAGGPAGSLIEDLAEEFGVDIVGPKMREIASATGQFFDAVTDQSLSHIDQAPLATALAGAQKRPMGDAWAWARRGVSVDISPLVTVTLAKWGLGAEVEESGDVVDNVW
ncbi:hypothetical protein [Streptomyces atratus]|uniref:hypothetical protein n=1 Tax=Streptomyces atratus TaxID=1893 RepID=UPI0036495BE4